MSSTPSDRKPNLSASDDVEFPTNPASAMDRKEIFRTLVQMQDQGESVNTSRIRVSVQFNITREELADIEREGISNNWPPL